MIMENIKESCSYVLSVASALFLLHYLPGLGYLSGVRSFSVSLYQYSQYVCWPEIVIHS